MSVWLYGTSFGLSVKGRVYILITSMLVWGASDGKMKEMKYSVTVQEAKCLPSGVYRVAVVAPKSGEVVSEHTVLVEESFVQLLGWESESVIDFVRASFQFLLDRETPAEILKEFNVQLITNYFPEYPEEMRKERL